MRAFASAHDGQAVMHRELGSRTYQRKVHMSGQRRYVAPRHVLMGNRSWYN